MVCFLKSLGTRRIRKVLILKHARARLQYDLAQQPRLLAHLPFSSMDLLELALESHRYALDINQDNADLLLYASFLSSNKDGTLILASNTAQVLTSLVEASTELKHSADNQINGMRFLQEALGLFQRCLSLQESQIMQSEEEHATSKEDTSDNDDGGTATRTDTAEGATSEEAWASIEEPVTRNSLIDTVIAQLETLTTICSLVISQGGDNLDWVEEYYSNMLKDKITLLVHDTERVQEASLANAKFIAAFSDASFRHGQLDILEYERELTAAFTINPDLSNHHEGLCDRADAEITFSTSIQASAQSKMQLSGSDSARLKEMRWKHITKALDDLRAASKTPHAEKLPRIHLRRGDCELLRYRLGQGPNPHSTAAKSASTLVKNAEVYYRGAAALARNARVQEEEREALVKEAILASLSGCKRKLHDLLKTNEKAVLEIIEDMREENLLSDEDIPI